MQPDYQNLTRYFQEIKAQFGQAKTWEEKRDLITVAKEIHKQAQEQVAQLESEIARIKKAKISN